MEELWLWNANLISEKSWFQQIDDLKSKNLFTNQKKVKEELKELFIQAIQKRIPKKKYGVFFSGGVDSSLIAALSKGICYVVGFQDGTKMPEDVVEAEKVAKKLKLTLRSKIYNLEEAEQIIKKTVSLLKKPDVVNVGVGAVVLAAAELAKKDRITYFLGGLGSEEIFAGYERHKVEDINQECWNGLRMMHQRDLIRDFTLSNHLGITLRTPFLDEKLIKFAMQIPGEWKLNKDHKKIILREVAEEFLGEFAWRKKKAAQYGSCFDKAIAKLTKKTGFKFKKDYLGSLK